MTVDVSPNTPLRPLRYNGTAYGIALGVATLLATIVLAHHSMPAHDAASPLAVIAAIATVDRWVHGALIAAMLWFALCFSGFSWRLGFGHPLVMAAWLSYVCGAIFTSLAGLIDGFWVPDVAALARPSALDQIALLLIANQGLTRLGLTLIGAAGVFWGHALLHHRGGARWIGFVAMATGGFSAAITLTAPHRIEMPELFEFMALQAAWNLTVAAWMVRGLKRPDGV